MHKTDSNILDNSTGESHIILILLLSLWRPLAKILHRKLYQAFKFKIGIICETFYTAYCKIIKYNMQ